MIPFMIRTQNGSNPFLYLLGVTSVLFVEGTVEPGNLFVKLAFKGAGGS
jgi:hypothetical protein